MLLEVIVRENRTARKIVIDASQVVVRNTDGTAILVAQDLGRGSVAASICTNEDDFNRTLHELGIAERTQCSIRENL